MLIFEGPTGSGKSATAQAISRALNKPLYLVPWDDVIATDQIRLARHLKLARKWDCIVFLRPHTSDVNALLKVTEVHTGIVLTRVLEVNDTFKARMGLILRCKYMSIAGHSTSLLLTS